MRWEDEADEPGGKEQRGGQSAWVIGEEGHGEKDWNDEEQPFGKKEKGDAWGES